MYGKSGINSPNHGKIFTDDTKNKMSEAKLGQNNHFFGKTHSPETLIKMSGAYNPKSKKVFVYSKDDLTILLFEFSTYIEASKHFNCTSKTISKYIDSEKLYLDKWNLSSILRD